MIPGAPDILGPERIILRDYQEEGLNRVRAAFGAGRRSVLLVAPTGAGKGTLAAYTLDQAAQKGSASLFVVHRKEIIRDVHKRMRRAGTPCGMIIPGEPYQPDAPIQVCSIQTLFARGVRPPADFVFWDECHHAVAKSYRQVREAYPRAKHLGATATPMRADRTALGDVFEDMIVIATTSELTERRFLVPCATFAPDRSLGDNLAQDPVSAYLAHGNSERAFVFVERTGMAKELAERFSAMGIAAACIDGKTPDAVRRRSLALFREGHIRVIVNVATMTEGIDVPEAKVCILGSKCATPAVFLQKCGRVLRPAEGLARPGELAILIDLCGNIHAHGLPGDDRTFSLTGKAITNTTAQIDNDPFPCPAGCGALVRPTHVMESGPGCPGCGWKKLPKPMAEILGERLHVYGDQLDLPFAVGHA